MVEIDEFSIQRDALFGVAYRMLGSVAEAEDIVQEAYLRWRRAPRGEIESTKAYLTTVVTRLCLDHLRSARVKREQYMGTWLPEPLVTSDERDPAAAAQLADSVTNAFLLVMETLAPVERAVFLLREVFGYEYAEIAAIVDKTEDNCRRMASRAKEHLAQRRPRNPVEPRAANRLLEEFLRACTEGNADALATMLAADAALYADGGGKVAAAGRPIFGAGLIAKFLANVVSQAAEQFDFQTQLIQLNGEPAIVAWLDGRPVQSMTFEIHDGRVSSIFIVRNPDKLKHLRASPHSS